jgi:DNA-binding NarL/FixJ family response regulator
MLRESLEYVINGQEDMKVIGSTDDASEALGLCRKLKPDLVLMDVVTKNDSSGIVYTAAILKELPDTKIVIMTAFPVITFSEEARKAGAHSFTGKEMGNDHLLYVIRKTMEGHSIYSTSAARMSFNSKFTEKELAVIRLVCKRHSRKEIASNMGTSESSVKQYITSILDKTGFDSISKFAIYAIGEGLIKTDT